MKNIAIKGGIAGLLLLPLIIWLKAEGNPLEYLFHQVPSGQAFYIFSKLIGLYAFFLVWFHIIWVLLKETPFRSILPYWKPSYHQLMGVSLMLIIILHALLFLIAVSLRNGMLAYSLFIPDFSDYYHSLLGLGVIALWLLPFIIYSGLKLKKTQKKRTLHRGAFLFYLLIFLHGIGIGSETKNGLLFWVYLLMGSSVFLILLYRVYFSFKTKTNYLLESE